MPIIRGLIFAQSFYQAICIHLIFMLNVKRSNTHNLLPIFHMLVTFSFSLNMRIMRKSPEHELLAYYNIGCSEGYVVLVAQRDL